MLSFGGVEGRMQRLDLGQEFQVVVDFAHTPDAIPIRIFKNLVTNFWARPAVTVAPTMANRSEPYQFIGDDKLPYDEVTEIEAAVARHFG